MRADWKPIQSRLGSDGNNSTLENVLSRLRRVRRNANGSWKALCPAHLDKNPSLSVTEREGKILLKCFAECPIEKICAAIGLELRELFSESMSRRRVVAEYDYTDETGTLLYQNVRYEPKDFCQRRPDGTGGWIYKLRGVRRVLYRLPEVLAATDILFVEGGKDCIAGKALGFTATTSGSTTSWREEFAEPLRGKRVTIIPDADDPGFKYARQVAISLYGKVKSLKVLTFSDAKDLGEWVAHGGTRDLLLELTSNAPEWNPVLHSASGFALTRLGDLLARPDIPVEYVVENLLVGGTVSCVAAKPKVGKSTFARNLCLCVSRGKDFLGFKTKQGECIYLALEEREEDLKNDFRAMGADGSEPILIHAAAAPAEGIAAVCDLVRLRRPVLLVIDPLFRIARIRDEKAYGETYAALGPLIDVAREAGTHLLLTHHASKSAKADAIDSPLGSTAIGGAVCSLIVLKRTESMRTIQTVQRIGQDMPEVVLQFDNETRSLSLGTHKSHADAMAIAEAICVYLKSSKEEKTEPEIDEAVEGKTGIKRKALRALVREEKVIRTGVGRKGDPFNYRLSLPCSVGIAGTGEQESAKALVAPIKTADILVPNSSKNEVLVPSSCVQEHRFDEGEL